jgi:hypothetical protein
MTTLDASTTATLNLQTRRNTTFSATVKNEAIAGASYECIVLRDDNSTLLSLTVTPSGNHLVISHPLITTPSGVYPYRLYRTAGPVTKRILEGSFIVLP